MTCARQLHISAASAVQSEQTQSTEASRWARVWVGLLPEFRQLPTVQHGVMNNMSRKRRSAGFDVHCSALKKNSPHCGKMTNPISSRLLATPISGRGTVYDPLNISISYWPIFENSNGIPIPLNVIYISKKKKNINRRYQGEKNSKFQIHFRLLITAKFLNQS